jgi:hypothetical protein
MPWSRAIVVTCLDSSRRGPDQLAADRIETDLFEEVTRTHREGLAEGILDLASARADGEGQLAHTDRDIMMAAQPVLGATGETGPVAGGLPRNGSTGG